MIGYVVESPVVHSSGGPTGTARVYVATEARAKEIVAEGAAKNVVRTYRALPLEDMPVHARENLERARAEG